MDTEAIKKSLLKKFQEVSADRLQKIQLAVLQLEKPENTLAADTVARELAAMQGRSIRVNVEVLASLGLMAGDLLVESARARLRTSELNGILQRFSRIGDRFLRFGEIAYSDSEDRSTLDQLESDLHLLRDDA